METTAMPLKNIKLILLLLIIAFIVRVLAQLIENFIDISFIANFDEWHSASIPYWLLFIYQIFILSFMIGAYLKIKTGKLQSSKLKCRVYLALGVMYILGTLTRHILGLTVLSDSKFFTSFLSIYFHYILASFLIGLGSVHLRMLRSGG